MVNQSRNGSDDVAMSFLFLKLQKDKGLSSGMSRPVPGFRPNEKRSDCVKELFNAGCTNMKIGVQEEWRVVLCW